MTVIPGGYRATGRAGRARRPVSPFGLVSCNEIRSLIGQSRCRESPPPERGRSTTLLRLEQQLSGGGQTSRDRVVTPTPTLPLSGGGGAPSPWQRLRQITP